MKRLLLALSITGLALASSPAQAAVQRSADFNEGHSLGVGLYGLSYDYGIGWFSAGVQAGSRSAAQTLYPSSFTSLNLSTRFLAKVYAHQGLSAGILGGVQLDPGSPGDRAYLTPDLGVAVAYDLSQFNWPFALRMNLTMAIADRVNTFAPINTDTPEPRGNFLQRLIFGPQTSFELAWLVSDQLEFTTGGGTLLGMRMIF